MTKFYSAILLFSVCLTAQSAFSQKNVKVFVALFPAGDFTATTADITGSAQLSASGVVAAKDIRINLKNLKTGLALRDDHAKNKYLEVSKFPEAILVSATGKDGKGSGVLKIKGKEAKVAGTYSLVSNNTFLKAEFSTKLSDFDIVDINYKGVGVDDEIKIEVTVPIAAAAAK